MNQKPPETVTQRLSRLMGAAGIEHFGPSEVLTLGAAHASNGLNTLPPLSIVHAIMPTLVVVDSLRDHLKSPVTILSGYRSDAYNKAIKGAKASMHRQFRALDISAKKHTAAEVWGILKRWRDQGLWIGGLGKYETFVHIDNRSANADWTG
jgi:hypothetical protein